MLRILIIFAVAILLLPQRPSSKEGSAEAGVLPVNVRALPLSADPAVTHAGVLPFMGAWVLTSPNKDFGGISSMAVLPEGRILTLSDSGMLFGFHLRPDHDRPFIAPLPVFATERKWQRWKWDTESMIHDPVSGRFWVGFELIQRVCRYSSGFARLESCVSWPEMQAWPDTGGAEAMVRLPDGRFLIFSEMGYATNGRGNDLLLFAGDPADPATPRPQHLRYVPPEGYRPTDAVWLDRDHLLVLNRRATFAEGFTAVVALVRLPELKEGAELVARPLARLAPPLLADNFEAMAISWEKGQRVLWIASDDNHEFFQRSLLLKFALPQSIVRDAAGH